MKTSLTFEDIEPGKSYACYFIVRSGLVSSQHFGVIKTRDCEQKLAEIVDAESSESHVVRWDDCWDLDEVEWHDSN